ncbi:hypothetical protein Goari_021148 [Gossypium aridum]|uniref:Uncharacterized protein n=1 Tax=Gossypium aridum TaxID=34290 RepID=A0A7J8YEZ6_GOSAI|nr:hypothetical protein [Gossypium aridum]
MSVIDGLTRGMEVLTRELF